MDRIARELLRVARTLLGGGLPRGWQSYHEFPDADAGYSTNLPYGDAASLSVHLWGGSGQTKRYIEFAFHSHPNPERGPWLYESVKTVGMREITSTDDVAKVLKEAEKWAARLKRKFRLF